MRREPLLHPVGPLPAAVYWRRRAVVVVVLLVAIVALGVLVRLSSAPDQVTATGSGDVVSGDVPAPAVSPSGPSAVSVSGEPEPRATPGASVDPQAAREMPLEPSGEPVGPVRGGDPGECSPDDVRVSVRVAPEELPVGGEVVLAVRAEAMGGQCRLDAGPVARSAEVRAGEERVWSTEDCEAGTRSEPVVIGPNTPLELVVRWEGARTAPGCPPGLPAPSPGDYAVVVQVGPARSAAVPFRLL